MEIIQVTGGDVTNGHHIRCVFWDFGGWFWFTVSYLDFLISFLFLAYLLSSLSLFISPECRVHHKIIEKNDAQVNIVLNVYINFYF